LSARAAAPAGVTDGRGRCTWATHTAMEADYHDAEWGVPVHDDQKLFEFITLEGAQAGLSWRTVLAKREAYRRAFHDWNIARIARMKDAELEKLLAPESGIVRNRLKVFSVRRNALAVQALIRSHGSLDAYLWGFVDGKPIVNRPKGLVDVPARTEVSDRLSKALKKADLSFVGSTIIYAFMQAVGMVDDHAQHCWRRAKV
jgi:DNA-3-methyladenine glycosylase I